MMFAQSRFDPKRAHHNQPSSPGLTGRPSTPQHLVFSCGALGYWIPAFAGMTALFGAVTC
jgi:hypothetical protein